MNYEAAIHKLTNQLAQLSETLCQLTELVEELTTDEYIKQQLLEMRIKLNDQD